jgi:putative ABC transport system permease protein
MGTALVVLRLALRDVRHHLAQAVLLVIAIAAAAAALTMGLAMSGVTSEHPYAVTRAATNGPDVVAYLSSASQANSLIHAVDVASYSGPYPIVSGVIRFDGRTADIFGEGRSMSAVAVDQPDVLSGGWVRPDGVVIERTFADALGVSVGDRVNIGGTSFRVAGIAVTAAQDPYPNLCNGSFVTVNPTTSFFSNACTSSFKIPFLSLSGGRELSSSRDVGEVWMTETDAIGLTSAANPLSMYALNVRLKSPAEAAYFAYSHDTNVPIVSSWEGVEREDELLVQDGRGVLQPGAVLLSLLAIASVAVLVGRRLSEYARRVGLLKAVGATPNTVAATFLAENLVLALFAAALGLAVGWLVAPLITRPGAALVGAAGTPPIPVGSMAEVIGLAVAIALVSTLVPAVRASRSSTVDAMNDTARAARRGSLVVRISRRLPVPVLFGLRLVARRPRRALLSAANVAVAVTGIVTVLAFHADVDDKLSGATALTAGGLSDPVINRDEQMLTIITIMLVTLAVLNAIFTTWATVLDAKRASALMRALGAGVRQVTTGLIVAQVLAALPGAILGVPLGLLLFKAAVKSGILPPLLWLWVGAAVVGTLSAMALLTVVPARIGARRSVLDVLQAESG